MKRHFVVDTSVFLTYAAYDKTHRLFNMVTSYSLAIFVNELLIDEIRKNLPKVLRSNTKSPEEIIENIKRFTNMVETLPFFNDSPDPKDNFLFDLAIQTDSEVIVTKEKALLDFVSSPVPVHDIKWFKETFPVPL